MNKLDCLKRAKELLGRGNPEDIRYAALEIRMAMEAITYEKLRSYAKNIPEDELATWQPPQAVKVLLEYDEHADESFLLYVGEETTFGQRPDKMHCMGSHQSLGLKWLKKHYNKIGGYLHFPHPLKKSAQASSEITAYLNSVLVEVEKAASSRILGVSLAEVYTFSCVKCERTVTANKRRTEATQKAKCINPQCGAEYFAQPSGDGFKFILEITNFECINCKEPNPIENRKLEVGLDFSCLKCGKTHKIASRGWNYGIPDNKK